MVRARGADFASFQDLAHTRAAIAHGLDFGIVKATEGLHYVNPLLDAQVSMLMKAGAVVGLYHFLSPGVDGVAQWDHFEQHARPHPRCLLAVDHEADSHGHVPDDNTVRAFIRRGQQRGFKVGRYGNSTVIRRRLGEDWTWAAWWSSKPPPFRWDVWQFAAGKHGDPDWNLYNGDNAALQRFAQVMGGSQKRPRPRWWLHDVATGQALGPYWRWAVGPAFVAYLARHPRSGRYTIERT